MKLGRRPVKASIEARIRELEAAGMGILKIGRTIGVGTSVVQRVLITQALITLLSRTAPYRSRTS
jgi:hypothetical protein